MRSVALALAFGLLAAAPAVVVNDRPLHVTAIERDGHVLAPMRSVFEALGAGVSYVDGRIVAQARGHRLQVMFGERAATVDGRLVRLDAAPQIVDGVAYVPLRFVASALGAQVVFDAATGIVTVDTQRASAIPEVAATVAPGELLPAPDTGVATAYPSIGAQLSGLSSLSDVHVTVDGIDVSQHVSVAGGSFLYIPPQGLPVGTHVVTVSGFNGGAPFAQTWSFQTTIAPAPSTADNPSQYGPYAAGYTGYLPAGGGPQLLQLSLDGNSFGPGAWVHAHLTAPPGGQAYLYGCMGAYRYPMYGAGGSFYSASIQLPTYLNVPNCAINAMYVDQFGNVTYVPYPVFVTIVGGQPTPAPVPIIPSPTPNPLKYHVPPAHRAIPPSPLPGASAVPPSAGARLYHVPPRVVAPPVLTTPHPLQPPTVHPMPLVTLRPLPRVTARPIPVTSAMPLPRPTANART